MKHLVYDLQFGAVTFSFITLLSFMFLSDFPRTVAELCPVIQKVCNKYRIVDINIFYQVRMCSFVMTLYINCNIRLS
jgi:hypothetical protein